MPVRVLVDDRRGRGGLIDVGGSGAGHDAIDTARGDTSRNASQAVVFRYVIGNPLPGSTAFSARCLICAGIHRVPGVRAFAVCRDVGGERRDNGLRFKDGVVRSDLDSTSYETRVRLAWRHE